MSDWQIQLKPEAASENREHIPVRSRMDRPGVVGREAVLGTHTLLELYGCRSGAINDSQAAEKILLEAARRAGMHVVQSVFHTFNPWGVSGVVIIAESHIAVHTWPEFGFAAVDIFTCGQGADYEAATSCILEGFAPRQHNVVNIPQGLPKHENGHPRNVPALSLGSPEWLHPESNGAAAPVNGAPNGAPPHTPDDPPAEQWFAEESTSAERHHMLVDTVIETGRTEFQSYAFLDTVEYGKMLVLDGRIQSAEDDEFIYHESLVHPALTALPTPKRVLVIGGGEGATVREVFRHPSVEKVIMVDIDGEVVRRCAEHLPEWHQGTLNDPRVSLLIQDGLKFVEESRDEFDNIIVDVTDSVEDGPAEKLFGADFLRSLKERLAPGGILTFQGMELSSLEVGHHAVLRKSLKEIFRFVCSYASFVPSFWCNWGFVAASDAVDCASLPPGEVDERLHLRGISGQLRHYDGQTHVHMFALPKDVRSSLA